MNLKELDSFKMADAIMFHDKLNPKLFRGQHLQPDVDRQLKLIADDFLQELGIKDLDVKDITISGSNAAYSYTPHSDLDLHILVDMNQYPSDEIYQELFQAKKTIYNDTHDIKVHGIPVELYVQDSNLPVVSLGEYSILNNKWLRLPTKRRSNFDQNSTRHKYEKLAKLAELAIKSKSLSKVKNVLDTIKRYRQAGLDKGGEFGPENLAYKALRSQGYITDLYDLRDKLHSKQLSLNGMYSNINENSQNEIHNYSKLDKILSKICMMVVDGQNSDKDYGMVGACVLDPDNNIVVGLNSPGVDGKRVHAERVAIEKYEKKYGTVPEGSIVITTLSPCNESDDETAHNRVGESCTDYLNSKGIEKVYCGYIDPTQDDDQRQFNMMETGDKNIRKECKSFADTFLKQDVNEAFDQPYKILRWEKGDFGDVDAIARLDDNTFLSIMFNKGFSQGTKEEAWSVEFYRNNSQEVTGEGDAQRVFATVISAIQTFIEKYKPNKITFSASKEVEDGQNSQSRARLYDSLVQRYARSWGFRAFRADTGNKVIYELSRIKPIVDKPVAEGSWKKPKFNTDTVVYDGAKANGISIFSAGYHPDIETAWIEAIKSVEPGAGATMVKLFEQWAKSQGAKTIRAEALQPSLNFWKKMGFNVVGNPSSKNRVPIEKHIGQQDVAEKTPPISPYAGVKDNQYRGAISEVSGYIPNKKKIKEIDYADYLDNSNFDEQKMLKLGKVDGEIQGHKVMTIDSKNIKIYFLLVNNNISAYLAFENGYLQNIKNFTNTEGVIRGLIGYIVHIKQQPINIADTERLTPDGIKWLIRLIKTPKGLTITNQNKDVVDTDKLEKEWQYAKTTGNAGPTSITIQEHGSFGAGVRLHEHRRTSHSLLMPMNLYDIPSTIENMYAVTEASGYIPSEKQKNDPRFKTALTVDIHPDSIKKNAKAFGSKISRAGIPPIANPSGKI